MEKLQNAPALTAAMLAVLGIAMTFGGYRITRVAARIMTGILAAVVGVLAGMHFGMNGYLALGAGAVLGIVGFAVGDAGYYLGVLLIGVLTGFTMVATVFMIGGWEPSWAPYIAGAVVCAILTVAFERPLAIFGTSFVGGSLLSDGLHRIMTDAGKTSPETREIWLYLGLVLLTTVLGCVVQAKTTKNLPDKQEAKQA